VDLASGYSNRGPVLSKLFKFCSSSVAISLTQIQLLWEKAMHRLRGRLSLRGIQDSSNPADDFLVGRLQEAVSGEIHNA
jgi:hypothetical protein